MHLEQIGLKDILDWVMPIIFAWIGAGVRKYLREMRKEITLAKESVVELNVQIAKILQTVEYQGRGLDDHEHRLRHVEQTVPRKRV